MTQHAIYNNPCNRYEHMLLATDLVSDETYLRNRAIELADRYGARLTAVHVMQDIPRFSDTCGYFTIADLNEKIESEVGAELKKIASQLKINEEDLKVAHGNAKNKIVDTANNLNCDLIIIGAHTRSGLAKLLGSTANGVIQNATCDVFVVKCPNQ